MYTVEEIKNKVETGTWTRGMWYAVWRARQMSDFTVYTEEIYYISCQVFAYNFQNMPTSSDRNLPELVPHGAFRRNPDFILPW